MKAIRKSITGMCADATACFPTWQIKRLKKEWLVDRILLRGVTNEGEIVVTPVWIATDHFKKKYMMDGITGTLYREDGSCLTSDHLKLLEIRHEDGLEQVILATKNTKAMGGA
jgi:hypothetical protein